MTIATLPPSNHLQAVRAFIERIRRSRNIPSAADFAKAEENLRALEAAVKKISNSTEYPV